jgi:glycosyltransferase involved in cell wall biosynthesis
MRPTSDGKSTPTVSVIIICFNYGKYVQAAVNSVLSQTLQDFEIIIVEGGSTDGVTRKIVCILGETRQLRIIFQSQRCTTGENRLTGLLDAKGKYAVFLDADDLLGPTYLEKAVAMLETSGADLLTADVKFFGDPAVIQTFRGLNNESIWETVGITPSIFRKNACSGSSVFRLSFWKENNLGYRTSGDPFEDWDFWCRIAANGGRSVHLAEPLHLYRLHGENMTQRYSLDIAKAKAAFRRRWKRFAVSNGV